MECIINKIKLEDVKVGEIFLVNEKLPFIKTLRDNGVEEYVSLTAGVIYSEDELENAEIRRPCSIALKVEI